MTEPEGNIMRNPLLEELRDFHDFVGERLKKGDAVLSPEEALDEWRRLHPETQASDEEVAAIRQALDDVAGGKEGIPFEEFDRAFAKRHHIPTKP
jgi:hypothetical protein